MFYVLNCAANNEASTLLDVHPEWIGLDADWTNDSTGVAAKVLSFVKASVCESAKTVTFNGATQVWIYQSSTTGEV